MEDVCRLYTLTLNCWLCKLCNGWGGRLEDHRGWGSEEVLGPGRFEGLLAMVR